MKIDITTKIILGVIAGALIWIGIQLTPTATAGPEIVAVDIQKIDGKPIRYADAIPVKIQK